MTPPTRLGDLDVEAYLADPAKKQAFVTPMFDVIAPRYDAFTRLFSFGMDASWKREGIAAAVSALDRVPARAARVVRVLDLASGTGDLAVGVARAVGAAEVTAIDASPQMIVSANARLRTRDADVASRVRTAVGDMCALPVPDASQDLITAGYGVRNVPEMSRAVAEMARVLRPGGTVVLLDFYRPEFTVWRVLVLWYLSIAGNAVGWWWHRDPVVYGYIARSIDHFVSWQRMSRELEGAGFRVTSVKRYLFGAVVRHQASRE